MGILEFHIEDNIFRISKFFIQEFFKFLQKNKPL